MRKFACFGTLGRKWACLIMKTLKNWKCHTYWLTLLYTYCTATCKATSKVLRRTSFGKHLGYLATSNIQQFYDIFKVKKSSRKYHIEYFGCHSIAGMPIAQDTNGIPMQTGLAGTSTVLYSVNIHNSSYTNWMDTVKNTNTSGLLLFLWLEPDLRSTAQIQEANLELTPESQSVLSLILKIPFGTHSWNGLQF